ncbi:hypothetical protein HAX54_017734 [Datura stramonium]|uniref:Uncharacterized protein n=1 Tax=Datura stramonium TaxID=4076 RepID=A0ABS8S0V2_DATST|nr:hypothetical protein [Datura stramonium]
MVRRISSQGRELRVSGGTWEIVVKTSYSSDVYGRKEIKTRELTTSSGTQNEGRDFNWRRKIRKKKVKMELMDTVSFSINQLKANESVMVKRKRPQQEVPLSSSNC